jgi:hypothetical protein
MPNLLILDDEFFGECLAQARASGLDVAGPFSSLQQVKERLDQGLQIDAALVDVDLDRELVFPLMDRLIAKGTVVVVYTGEDVLLPDRFWMLPRFRKPTECGSALAYLLSHL